MILYLFHSRKPLSNFFEMFGLTQTLDPKKTWVLGLVLDLNPNSNSDTNPIPNLKPVTSVFLGLTNSEFNSIDFGVEIK